MTNHELIDYWKIKQALAVLIRNSDVLTTTVRGVTTHSDIGTFTAASSHTLSTSPTLVKNVRSVIIDGIVLEVLNDYTVNYTTGVITFTNAQTGDYTISYDTGNTDKIFPDFPKPELKLSSFPRVAVDLIDVETSIGGFGNVNKNNIDFTIVVYDSKIENVENYLTTIRSYLINNRALLRSQIGIIRPLRTGPILNSQESGKGTKIYYKNIDFRGILKYEVV